VLFLEFQCTLYLSFYNVDVIIVPIDAPYVPSAVWLNTASATSTHTWYTRFIHCPICMSCPCATPSVAPCRLRDCLIIGIYLYCPVWSVCPVMF